MSRYYVAALLLLFAAVLAIGYFGLVPLGNDETDEIAEGEHGEAAAFGESIYTQQCAGCHTTDGSDGVGPTFAGLYGSEVTMDDGSTVVVDEDHLYEAITDPRATTREDFPDVMPAFDNLDDEEVSNLIAFIRTLE